MMPLIRIGLPYSANTLLAKTAASLGDGTTLISAGSLWKKGKGWGRIGAAAWATRSALDSAGFVAMLQGGYRWDVASYVEFVCTNGGTDPESGMPCPWDWWSAMDFCCEQEIASDRATVLDRIDRTINSYRECYAHWEHWCGEGVTDVPPPMPILQGRFPEDYLRCAEALAPLPELVGIGSVCRRSLKGYDGLIRVMDALHRTLPARVKLHLFGVKGDALRYLQRWPDRIASIDSMAWDSRASNAIRDQRRAWVDAGHGTMQEANKRFSCSLAHRAHHMREWHARQVAHAELALGLRAPPAPTPQLSLFGAA